jgi:hypothetical protein
MRKALISGNENVAVTRLCCSKKFMHQNKKLMMAEYILSQWHNI